MKRMTAEALYGAGDAAVAKTSGPGRGTPAARAPPNSPLVEAQSLPATGFLRLPRSSGTAAAASSRSFQFATRRGGTASVQAAFPSPSSSARARPHGEQRTSAPWSPRWARRRNERPRRT
jgi:hypothetical protein